MSQLKDINYQPLAAMRSTISQAFRQTLNSWAILPLLVLAGFLVAAIFRPSILPFVTYPLFAAFIAFIVVYTKYARQDQDAVWQDFAGANNWKIDTTTSPMGFVPASINTGHNQYCSSVIEAEIGSVTAYVFSYQTTIGEGKSAVTYPYTLAITGVHNPLPHMLLINKKGARLIVTNHENEKLKLEGNFSDSFTLQIDKGQEINALTILTPDVMQVMLDHGQRESIEITGRNVCFIMSNESRSPQDVQALFEAVGTIYPQIAENANHYS